MTKPLLGALPPIQNPFATASPKKDAAPSFLNFIRPLNGFGTPSGPITTVFDSNTTVSSSAVWPNAKENNIINSQTFSAELSSGLESSTGTASYSTSIERQSFQPFTNNTMTSKSNKELKSVDISTSQEVFGIKSIKDNSQSINVFSKSSNLQFPSSTTSNLPSNPSPCDINGNLSTNFAEKIKAQLIKDKIFPPKLTELNYYSNRSDFIKAASELQKEYMNYRVKVRASLIKANLLDDPKVQKKLADAIDFKGTCDQMCPDYECLARIVEGRHDKTERDIEPDGSLAAQPRLDKMVKALARSAAGQDAPLPCDIRTTAALRRTVDYLFNNILAERELESVHGFLWDRTRAIRRDFVFHSFVTPTELLDQIYCLERIIRFHAISLHYMSKDGISTEGFSDQQEREQLSRSLLSLIHAYDDCEKQGINCENEIEFKAYYIIFNGEIPGILETVQNWGFDLWENSEIIRNAVCLSESLQNIWDFHGPLNPVSTMELSQNAYSRFFSIVEDPSTSYTMACFAEIYFNKIRKAILRTILISYKKQRVQTKDWTAEKLNTYLRFDDQNEVEPFVELYGLHFTETDNEWCLSFDSNSSIKDPHPLPKQPHSYHLVERKRGTHSLVEAINSSVYESEITSKHILHKSPTKDSAHVIKPILKKGNEPYTNSPKDTQPVLNPFATDNSEPSSESITTEVAVSTTCRDTSKNIDPDSLFVDSKVDLPKNFINSASLELPLSMKNVVDKSFSQQQSTIKETPCHNPFSSDFSKKISKETLTSTPNLFPLDTVRSAENLMKEQINSGGSEQIIHNNFPQPRLHQKKLSDTALSSSINSMFNPERNKPQLNTGSEKENFKANFSSNLPSLRNPLPSISLHDNSSFLKKANDNIVSKTKSCESFQKDITEKLSTTGKNPLLDNFAKWIFNGDEGLLEQFSDFQARNIIHNTFLMYQTEKLKKLQEEEEKEAMTKADQFRRYSLSVKFGYLWREQVRRIRLRRKGREARQGRLEMAQSLKSKRSAQSSSIIEDFKASVTQRRRQRDVTSIEACDQNNDISSKLEGEKLAHKRRRSDKSSISNHSSLSKHQTPFSSNSLNRSLLSDPSYLSGQSRLHLIPLSAEKDENYKSFNGVKSDYFRLKARGIINGIGRKPHSISNKEVTHHCASINEQLNDSSLHNPIFHVKMKSDLNDFQMNKYDTTIDHEKSMDYESDLCLPNQKEGQKILSDTLVYASNYIDDESALFDRAKKVREQMDEGAEWFKREITRSEFKI
ncbi:putative leucine permease transcriptional regulator [Erysiphe necator]|uniref:Putative leucine permease transcriptional regulator n=1 Tax=Uncinula necator TaxID=52586 RepID=A0A0B1NZP7_UNCNE|nr:putative leucine permease transcriptional regulator [Erysiphe necator]